MTVIGAGFGFGGLGGAGLQMISESCPPLMLPFEAEAMPAAT